MRQGLPGERQGSPRLLLGPSEDQAPKNKVCKTEDQDKAPARGACRAKEARPRQEELAGTTEPKHRDPGKRSLPGRPFQAQDYFTNTRPRQEGLTRKTRRLHYRRHASALYAPRRGPGERQASEPGKFPGPARSRPRQGTCRGELCCVPALQLIEPRVALGAIPGTRGGWLCSLGDTLALHGGEAIAVANGDARAGAFGVDGDGH